MANKVNTKVEEVEIPDVEITEETTEIKEVEETEMKEKVGFITKIKEAAEKHPKMAKAAKAAGLAVGGVIVGVLGYKKLTSKTYIDAEFTDADDVADDGYSTSDIDDSTTESEDI